MAKVVTHLTEVQCRRGHLHLFLYTKCSAAAVFRDLGFYEIARAWDEAVFMENRAVVSPAISPPWAGRPSRGAGGGYCHERQPLHLRSSASGGAGLWGERPGHLFIVSEEAGPHPRRRAEAAGPGGTAHLKNLVCHDTGPYLVSTATFPSYFQRDEAAVIHSHAGLDAAIFLKIARALGIRRRVRGGGARQRGHRHL